MQKLQQILKAPYYFQWLILFFVLHGYSEFVGFIQISSLLLLIVELTAVAWVLFFLFRKMYGDAHKATLLVTVLFFLYLFFYAVQEGLAAHRALYKWSLFPRLVPVIVVLSAGTFIGLFRYKRSLVKLNSFLNVVFLTLALYDTCSIIWQAATLKSSKAPVIAESIKPLADTVAKPDVYLILLDEYLGSSGLQEYYHYDNSAFEATKGKAVIMVMSDHGNRDGVAMPGKFFGFTNFNAIYLPNKDYHLWYDSVSNVNQFPLLFNTLFGQQIPLKKDSSVR